MKFLLRKQSLISGLSVKGQSEIGYVSLAYLHKKVKFQNGQTLVLCFHNYSMFSFRSHANFIIQCFSGLLLYFVQRKLKLPTQYP